MLWHELLGTIGVAIIVLVYILLQTERVNSGELTYSLLNAIGAALILISLYYSYNLPSVIVESFWLAISLFGIGKYLARKP